MESKILFSETQRFKQWWVWIILIGVNTLMFYSLYSQVIEEQQFGDKPATNTQLLIGTGISLLITVFVLSFQLDTKIKSDGIYVRLFPLQLSFRFFPWNNLSKCYVRKYNPIAEYGGWGFRLGLFGKGKAYNIAGDEGLQLEFNDNKKLLIGTQKPEELSEVVNNFRLQ